MRILFVAQRYGLEVAGGAELHCRRFATRLAAAGHQVEVATSRAVAYTDWADVYPSGAGWLDGVLVHRFPVRHRRDTDRFGPINARTVVGFRPRPLLLQRAWMDAQGPVLDGFVPWLEEEAGGFDVAVFFTYLYWTTWAGLPVAAGRTATVLHATAHDEPHLELPLFDPVFRLPTRHAWSTVEERDLVWARAGRRRGAVVGIGTDLDAVGEGQRFRDRFGLDARPYLLYVGRVDPAKGSAELHRFFTAYRERRPGPLALVIAGDPVHAVPVSEDVILTGYLDDQTLRDAVDGALAVVVPSYFESFSMVLAEAWAQGRAALVQGRCAVLAGQARRSGGAIPWSGYAEFEAAVDALVHRSELAGHLGRAGRRYVETNYRWDTVMGRYGRLLAEAVAAGPGR